jgi:tetratricopeptide (TPR) repeat protein
MDIISSVTSDFSVQELWIRPDEDLVDMLTAIHKGFAAVQRSRLAPPAAALVAFHIAWMGLVALGQEPPAETPYRSAEEAYRVGAAYVSTKNYKASLEPLEAALRLEPDDDLRLKINLALIPAYRTLPEIGKFVLACEYVIDKADSETKRSLIRRTLLSTVHVRGEADELIERHEDILKKDGGNRLSLYILSEAYTRLKRDPQRAAELIERLAKLDEKPDGSVDISRTASLAQQYVRAKKYAQGAELYEQIAPLDAKLAAWHYKEAATAWLAGGDREKALAAAKRSAHSPPEKRSEILAYFWRRGLADVFLATGEPNLAIEHYLEAINNTTIEGYIKDCEKLIDDARRQVE